MSTDGARPLARFGEYIISEWKGDDHFLQAVFGPDTDGYFWQIQRIQSGTRDFPCSIARKWVVPFAEVELVRCDWANELEGEIVHLEITSRETT